MFILRWLLRLTAGFIIIVHFGVGAEDDDDVNLENYLQPLYVGRDPKYDDLIDDDQLCSRNCTAYPESRICYYKLVAEQYHVMGPACENCPTNQTDCFDPECITGDGIERSVLVFNRLLPGPAFHVCVGDRIVVDVENKMPAREVSIHWHGQMQKSSPWEDGVPFVTQCPIISNTMFRYDFLADTSGSQFYHSHSPLQLFNGLSGPFIIRTSSEIDPMSNLYDYDLFSHTIQIRSWYHDIIDVRYPGYNKNQNLIGLEPISYLINGKGRYMNAALNQSTETPLAEFNVKPFKKYRFRIITDTPDACSLQFTIENHPMLLIAADGIPVKPQMVRSLYLAAADIYDVVVTTNQPSRPYWIFVRGYDPSCSPAYQKAIFRYEGTGTSFPDNPNTTNLFNAIPNLPELNNVRKPCHDNPTNLCLDEINSLQKVPDRLLGEPDQRFIFEAGTFNYTEELYHNNKYWRNYLPTSGPGVKPLGGMYEDTINNKSNMMPPFILLSDPSNPLIDRMTCSDECPKHCDCLNLIKLGYNNVTEMIFIDKVSNEAFIRDHPFHIHGHHFSIMKLGTSEELISDPDCFKVNTSNTYPLVRKTVPVPAHGFAIIRFIADNPGFWLLHCHFATHNDNGMQIVLQVGEPEQFLEIPDDWPKCGNYLPPVRTNS